MRSTTGTSGRPRAHPQPLARIADLHPERLLDDVERLVDEELLHPLEVAHVERLPEPEGVADLGAHLGGNGERELSGRVVGGEVEQREDDEADRDEGGDREEQAADDVADHVVAAAACVMVRLRPEPLTPRWSLSRGMVHPGCLSGGQSFRIGRVRTSAAVRRSIAAPPAASSEESAAFATRSISRNTTTWRMGWGDSNSSRDPLSASEVENRQKPLQLLIVPSGTPQCGQVEPLPELGRRRRLAVFGPDLA